MLRTLKSFILPSLNYLKDRASFIIAAWQLHLKLYCDGPKALDPSKPRFVCEPPSETDIVAVLSLGLGNHMGLYRDVWGVIWGYTGHDTSARSG